jgi:hypothetical protein
MSPAMYGASKSRPKTGLLDKKPRSDFLTCVSCFGNRAFCEVTVLMRRSAVTSVPVTNVHFRL